MLGKGLTTLLNVAGGVVDAVAPHVMKGAKEGINFGSETPLLNIVKVKYAADENITYRTVKNLTPEQLANKEAYEAFCYRRENGLQTPEDLNTCYEGDRFSERASDSIAKLMMKVLGIRVIDTDEDGKVVAKEGFW